jgi:hypothetical protein
MVVLRKLETFNMETIKLDIYNLTLPCLNINTWQRWFRIMWGGHLIFVTLVGFGYLKFFRITKTINLGI